MTGETKGATYVSVTVESGEAWGSMDNQVVGVLNDESFDIDADGRFEILLGGEPRQRNWLALPEGAGSISTRHYFEDATHAAADPARVPTMRIEVVPGGGDDDGNPVIPGGSLADHDGTPVIPGGSLADHDGTPVIPGGSLADHDGTPVIPGGSLADHDGTPVIPGGSPADHDGTPVIPGGSPADHDRTPVIPGGSPADHDGTPVIPGGSPADHDRTPATPASTSSTPATTPPPRPSDATVAAGIRRVAALVRELTVDRPPTGQSQPRSWISRVPNEFPPPGKPGDLGLAAFDAAYAMAPFLIGPDEALVIRARWPQCRYANVCLWNRHLQTFDYASRSISLNRAQTVADADGRFTAVIAHTDPGTPNWLDTEGRPFGIVYWRFMLPEGEIETPQAELVPLPELPAHL